MIWEIERDRFGIMFSGPLEVGECVQVVPFPVVVTDEMVERAASALAEQAGFVRGHLSPPFTWADVTADYKIEARAALEAALNGKP